MLAFGAWQAVDTEQRDRPRLRGARIIAPISSRREWLPAIAVYFPLLGKPSPDDALVVAVGKLASVRVADLTFILDVTAGVVVFLKVWIGLKAVHVIDKRRPGGRTRSRFPRS